MLPRAGGGRARGEWVLLDYLDCVLHVFTPDARERYRLEQLWGEAERLEVRSEPPGQRGRRIPSEAAPRLPLVAGNDSGVLVGGYDPAQVRAAIDERDERLERLEREAQQLAERVIETREAAAAGAVEARGRARTRHRAGLGATGARGDLRAGAAARRRGSG